MENSFSSSSLSDVFVGIRAAGGTSGRRWVFKPKSPIKQIIIRHGSVIDSLSFICENGERSPKFGGNGGDTTHTVKISTPDEFLTGISGTIGKFGGWEVIKSLWFNTNTSTYGPFGKDDGKSFSLFVEDCSDCSLVGFHGRSGSYLVAVGYYARPPLMESVPLNRTTINTKLAEKENLGRNDVSNIILNHDFSEGLHLWRHIWCEAFVITSESIHPDGTHPTNFPYALVTKRKACWNGLEQDITSRVTPGSTYMVSAQVGVSGTSQGCNDVQATLKLEFQNSDTTYVCIGRKTVQENGWETLEGTFLLTNMPYRVIFYLEGPSPGVNLLIKSAKVSCASLRESYPSSDAMTYLASRNPGPFGGVFGKEWDDGVFTSIRQILVHVDDKVNAIQGVRFEYRRAGKDGDGSVWGARHGNASSDMHKICIDCRKEFLMGISGYYSPVESNGGMMEAIRSIQFMTNMGVYGPFGSQLGTYFCSPIVPAGKIVGFFGKAGLYLHAIGVHMEYEERVETKVAQLSLA